MNELQVCQEDIVRTLCATPCPSDMSISEISDDHPLRVLSEENLSCSSNFTGDYNKTPYASPFIKFVFITFFSKKDQI